MLIKDTINTIVTHANCPDGKASAMMLKKVYPNAEVKFITNNSKEHTEMEPTPGIIFCDFSPHPSIAQRFVEAGSYVLDHHKYSKDVVEAFGERGVFADEMNEPGVSGAVLAFREVYLPWAKENGSGKNEINRLKEFVTLVGIRDCWLENNPAFRTACEQSSMMHFYDEQYLLDQGEIYKSDLKLGKYLYKRDLARAKETAEKKLIIRDKIAVMCGTDTSDVAGIAADIHGIDILAGFKIVIEEGNAKVVVSMRSRGETDVGVIAKANGGGGHKHAAGFSFDLNTSKNYYGTLIDVVFSKIEEHIHYVGPDWIKVGAVLIIQIRKIIKRFFC
jgi:oligoribonuclease NrnB/cAMP/cGMP phosphodiesterase (DHH superfamily)